MTDILASRFPVALVVEDDFASRQHIMAYLKMIGFSAYSAASGENALDLMHAKTVDVMLLDYALGDGMTGSELMKHFRKQSRFRDLPIIIVTAYRDMRDDF